MPSSPHHPTALVLCGAEGGLAQAAHTPWGPPCTPTAALALARHHTAPREQAGVLVKVGGGISTQITYLP